MRASRFDRWTRTLFTATARRRTFAGVLSALSAVAVGLPAHVPRAAAKKRKKNKKKIRLNEFGCVDVGNRCKNAGQCCSGICKGKKGKKKCKAHDTGSCLVGQKAADCGGVNVSCTSSAGLEGTCNITTGNASYCLSDAECFPCRKDADCQPFCGPVAACVACAGLCDAGVSTLCAGPSACVFPPE